jgi:hypothetical protein
MEALDAAFAIDQLLAPGEEGVAVGTDFHPDIALVSGSGGESVPTGADHVDFAICGVYPGFHETWEAFLA